MNREFNVVILTPKGVEGHTKIASLFDALLNGLSQFSSTNTREFSIVKTKLEEACFFAKKNLTTYEENPNYSYPED